MNGAESLVATLVDAGVEVCFANPGTSEMHFIAALDRSERMGVAASRAAIAEEFAAQFASAMGERGPRLIEALI